MMPAAQTRTDVSLRERLRAEALRLGFSRCGFTTADPLGESSDRRWKTWLAEGRAGAMDWLARDTPRRTHPEDLLPGAKTAIVVLAGYYAGDHPPDHPPDSGKIARYAWGKDYHLVMREKLNALGEWLHRESGQASIQCRPCVDSAPIDERALAVRAGLGFIGKHSLLISPPDATGAAGTWSLIGVLLTTLEMPPDQPLRPAPELSCGSCRRCIDACPTAAIDAPYRVDPRRCISYLTIEQKEAIPPDLAPNLNHWVFGCDICQEVCPFNATPLNLIFPELAANHGAGPTFSETQLTQTPSGKSFNKRWKQTPLGRAGLKALTRNLRALLKPT